MRPQTFRTRAAVGAVAVSVLLAACGSSSSSTSPSSSTSSSASSAPAASSASTSAASAAPASGAPASGKVTVAISNYAFHPASLTVAPGAKVTFTNHDQTAHTATSRSSAFDTGTLKPGESATVTLKKPGTYTYYCQFHAFMTATIVVK